MIDIDEKLKAEAHERRRVRDELDLRLAHRLVEAGVDAFETCESSIVDVALDGSLIDFLTRSGSVQPRRWGVFEGTQAAAARLCRARLELFSQTIGPDRRSRFRMFVISAGWVKQEDLKAAIPLLRTVLRRISTDKILNDLCINLHFANLENTIYVNDPDATDREILYNLHSHLLIEPTTFIVGEWRSIATGRVLDPAVETDRVRLRKLEKSRRAGVIDREYKFVDGWTKVLDRVREINTIKNHCHDAGPVIEFDEFLKYMTKETSSAAETNEATDQGYYRISLDDLSPSELRTYHEAIFRRNRFQSYGEFKGFVKSISAEVEEYDPDTGEIYETAKNIKNKIVTLDDGTLALTPVFPRDLQVNYNQNGCEDILVGLPVRPNAAGVMVGCFRILNPSDATIANLASFVKKRGLEDLVEEHAQILAWHEAQRAGQHKNKKHTRQLSLPPPPASPAADPSEAPAGASP